MTPDAFRKLALAFPGAEEKSHLGKADFRVRNKIFATLPDGETGVVKLTREQQETMVAAEPKIFSAVKGGWGFQGWTRIALGEADETTLKSALSTAFKNVAPKKLKG
jgi:hypothetical protein